MINKVNKRRSYRPWRRDYYASLFYLSVGIASSWYSKLSGNVYIGAILAIWLTVVGCKKLWRGQRRERGAEVEASAIESMRLWFDQREYSVRFNLDAGMWIGDIDSVIIPEWTLAAFVVEIKSFPGIERKGRYYISKTGSKFPLYKPINQVLKQCRHLGKMYYPVLWMPESKLFTRFVFKNVLIVNGDVKFLESALIDFDDFVKIPAKIQFPYAPPDVLRFKIKKDLKFDFNVNNSTWYGEISKQEKAILEPAIHAAGGICEFNQVRNLIF